MKSHQVWIKNNVDSNVLDYDYDIISSELKALIMLTYSNTSDWSEGIKGSVCAKLEDDGEIVKIKIGNNKIKLSYSELRELKCLLLFENDEHIEIRQTNTTKMLK
jgi:hypothetical protein